MLKETFTIHRWLGVALGAVLITLAACNPTGGNAATKCYKVCENTERVLAIELFNAAQALDFRHQEGLKSSPKIEKMVADYCKEVNFVDIDEIMYKHIHSSVRFLQEMKIEATRQQRLMVH